MSNVNMDIFPKIIKKFVFFVSSSKKFRFAYYNKYVSKVSSYCKIPFNWHSHTY